MITILFIILLLTLLGMAFLKYMRRVIVERDLNYYGEDIKDVSLWQRLMSRVIPMVRIWHSKIVALWYGHPSAKMKLVGVTGTNGKTTTATVLYDLFREMGHRCGLISTVNVCVHDELKPAVITTPGAVELNRVMKRMLKAGCEYVFMECSSHGLVHKRVSGLHFAGGIFTNLTRDHLNYHRTFDNYRHSKKSFFDLLPSNAFAIVNADDENSGFMVQDCKATKKTYSTITEADFRAKILKCDFEGMLLDIDGREVKVNFVGQFNASNLLAIYGTAVMLGKTPDDIIAAMPAMRSVKGRLEPVRSPKGFIALVDYAHTPDALHNVLETIRGVVGKGKVITVCGAGGDSDKGKRPLMAKEMVAWSDTVILTNDNPRFEEPKEIINDMLAGLDEQQKEKVTCLMDRREAIRQACEMARKGDVILVAGKGHEDYQEVKGVKHHFSDQEVLREIIEAKP